MIITRKLLGFIPVRITLTDAELYSAYEKQKHEYDIADVKSKIEGRWDEDEIPERLKDPEVIERIAYKSRRYQDNNDCISECLWDCVEYAINQELDKEE